MIDQPDLPVALSDEAFKQLKRDVQRDGNARSLWMKRQAHFLRRRFSVEDTTRTFPWPGASTIVMPTLDTAIKRLTSSYIQSTLGPETPITVRGETPESVGKEVNVERRLRHMLESRIPDAEKEVALAADVLLQHGHVVIAVSYEKRTRMARETLRRDRLPDPLGKLIPKTVITDEEADRAFRFTGQPKLSAGDMQEAEPIIRRELRFHYGLDPEDPQDKKTEDAIFRWLVKGKPETLTIKRREVYLDTPVFVACLPEDVFVNPGVQREQLAPRVTLRQRMPRQQFTQAAVDEGWDEYVVSKVKDEMLRGTIGDKIETTDYLAHVRQFVHAKIPVLTGRLDLSTREMATVYRTFFWYDIDGDGLPERCVCVWAPYCDKPLKVYELSFDFYEWPIVQIRREHTERAWYNTRGIPEVLDSLDREITEQHRQKLNSMRIANAPTFKARINSGLAAYTNQWVPGQYHWVQRMDDLEPLQVPSSQVSYEREEQILSGWVERLAGIFDSSLTDQGRLTRPRTATEIGGVTSLQEQAIGADLLLWHKGWAKVWRMLWALDLQFGPDELYVRVAGLDQPIRQTRHEIQGRFDFQPSPAALQSPVLRLQKTQLLVDTMVKAIQSGVNFGDEYEVHPEEAFLMLAKQIDPRQTDRFIRRRTPEEVAQIQAQKAQSQGAVQVPPSLFNGPPAQAAQLAQQTADVGQESDVPIQVRGVGGYV